jgi:hypothetical protein
MNKVSIAKFDKGQIWGIINEDTGSLIAVIGESNMKSLAEQLKKVGFL